MKITVITVGKLKEKYLKDAVAEYAKRLGKYCRLEILEVPDEKTPDQASETVCQKIKAKEGERILDQEVTYTETPGLVKADVLLEVERDIGVEQKIDMKKEDAEREKK